MEEGGRVPRSGPRYIIPERRTRAGEEEEEEEEEDEIGNEEIVRRFEMPGMLMNGYGRCGLDGVCAVEEEEVMRGVGSFVVIVDG